MPARNFPADFGRYRLTGLLGSGGMAEVYRAETQPVAGITREVAIKRLLYGTNQDAALSAMLLDEARIWVRLQHPNIVTVYEFGEADGDFFLALELVEGCTAGEMLRDEGPFPLREALCIVERVARALAYAHSLEEKGRPLKIVHRDVKPGNILLSRRGEVKLTDFGIARATDRVTRTQVGMIKGSLAFMAPEQVREEPIDGRADLFALGCTLHALLTGQPLLDKTREAAMLALARGEIPAPPENLPGPVRALLRALTAARKEDRPPNASEVARQIRALLQPALVEDIEPAIGARVERMLQRAETVKAIRAQQTPMGVQIVTATSPHSEPSRTLSAPAARSAPAGSNSVLPQSDASLHPSWRDVNEAALPEGDDLDARDRALDAKIRNAPSAGDEAPTARPSEERGARRRPASAPNGSGTETTAPAAVVPNPARDPRRGAPRAPSPMRPLESGAAAAVEPARGTRPPASAQTTGLSRIFEVAPRLTDRTGKFIRGTPLHWKIALGAFFLSVLVIALLVAPLISRTVRGANCAAVKTSLDGELRKRGLDAAPELSRALEVRCATDPEAPGLRARMLALSGDTRGMLAALPPAERRTPDQRLLVAAAEHASRDYRAAEADAWAIAREGRGDAAPQARCLAAAAALNQDHPERVEGYLTGANDDCARLLRAAAAFAAGNRTGAQQLLSRNVQETRNEAGYESALAVLHLFANDQEEAQADAKVADDKGSDVLAPHPWVWYTMPSPRGGEPPPSVLRVTGPADDAGFYTRVLQGDAARAHGNLELAIKFYDQAVDRGGRTGLADLRAAAVLLKQGKPPLARSRLSRAINLDPTYGPALIALATIEEHDSDPAVQSAAVSHAIAALAVETENRDAKRIASHGRP